jgi:hypothetical protein
VSQEYYQMVRELCNEKAIKVVYINLLKHMCLQGLYNMSIINWPSKFKGISLLKQVRFKGL